MTWGHPDFGGDSSVVQHRLKDVRAIHATEFAFAAILADGSAVTWGDLECTDDSPATDQLRSARQVQGNKFGARAAVLADGSVVTWGDAHYGGDSSAVQDQLQNVQQLEATDHAFAAVVEDGSLVTWGYADYGGDSSRIQEQLAFL